MSWISRIRLLVSLALTTTALVGCHLDNILKVATPAGVSSAQSIANQTGAEAAYNGGKIALFTAVYSYYNGLIQWTGLLGDEFTWSAFSNYEANYANIDARQTAQGNGYYEFYGDETWGAVLQARAELLASIPGLRTYEPAAQQSRVGEAYALIAYAELFVAEGYCGGTPLSQLLTGGGFQFGVPVTDDSLLGVAAAHFDSALAHAAGNDTVLNLANVGRGRVLLDRGHADSAAAAVQGVPASFVYDAQMPPTFGTACCNLSVYAIYVQNPNSAFFNVANGKGENGLDFLTANDVRLTFDSSNKTVDGGTWYLPMKFEVDLADIPMATGLEAALIQAEAALSDGNSTQWLTELNALRNTNCTVSGTDTTCTLGTGQVAGQTEGLSSLTDPGTDSGRVSLMFRERAFWLYGTGSRLGDLRRLVRQYGRDQSLVFPVGPFPNGTNPNLPSPILNYGADVDLTLPTRAAISSGNYSETNPNYKGCIVSTTSA